MKQQEYCISNFWISHWFWTGGVWGSDVTGNKCAAPLLKVFLFYTLLIKVAYTNIYVCNKKLIAVYEGLTLALMREKSVSYYLYLAPVFSDNLHQVCSHFYLQYLQCHNHHNLLCMVEAGVPHHFLMRDEMCAQPLLMTFLHPWEVPYNSHQIKEQGWPENDQNISKLSIKNRA